MPRSLAAVGKTGKPYDRIPFLCHHAGMDALFVADLDGTITQTDGSISPQIQSGFRELGERGITRVIATGRVLRSAVKVLEHALEFDYLIFSNGAGTVEWKNRAIRNVHSLLPDEVSRLVGDLKPRDVDFMVLDPIPDNHRFFYHRSAKHRHGNRRIAGQNDDFERRLDIYRNEAIPFSDSDDVRRDSSEVLVIVPPPSAPVILKELSDLLSNDFSLIRTTSPLDHQSLWIEIFSLGVGKGAAAEQLRSELNIEETRTVAVGNDYNDLDLLAWAENSFVMDNAPADLKKWYPVVPSNEQNGLSRAIAFCLALS